MPAEPTTGATSPNTKATLAMSVSAAGYAAVPLLIHLAAGDCRPLTIQAVFAAGLILAYAPYLALQHYRTIRYRRFLPILLRTARSPLIAVMIISNFEIATYALATRFIDIAVAALLFESWPIPCIALTAWLYRGQHRYQTLDRPTLLLIAGGTAGAALAVASQHGTPLHLERTDFAALAAGTTLALLSAALTAGAAASLRWGTFLNRNLLHARVPIRHGPQAELLGACTASLIADVIIVPLFVILALLAQEDTAPLLFVAAAVGAALCQGLSSLL